MTMMMTGSQFGLGDMEALLLGPSSPMADPTGTPRPHSDPAEELHGPEGPLSFFASSCSSSFSSLPAVSSSSASPSPFHSPPASPPSPLPYSSSAASPSPFYSPPASPPSLLPYGDKAGIEPDVLSLPWLAPSSPRLGHVEMEVAGCKGDAFCDLDWMTGRMDLSEFDLDSLIGTCSADDDAPSSPEELLASLDCPSGLALPGLAPLTPPSTPPINVRSPPSEAGVGLREAASPPPPVPESQEELEIKSEPDSPVPSPAYALDLGSEVDVVDCEMKPTPPVVVVAAAAAAAAPPAAAAVVPQVPRFVVSLSPLSAPRIVLVLTPKDQVATTTTVITRPAADQSSPRASATSSRTPRSRPYPDPSRQSPGTSGGGKVRSTRGSPSEAGGSSGSSSSSSSGSSSSRSKAPKDKKLKKMEQNKTAATRYRQKKRVEQESLSTVYTDLERKNIELTEKADSMAREIQYLKDLMEEVRTARLKKGLSADL